MISGMMSSWRQENSCFYAVEINAFSSFNEFAHKNTCVQWKILLMAFNTRKTRMHTNSMQTQYNCMQFNAIQCKLNAIERKSNAKKPRKIIIHRSIYLSSQNKYFYPKIFFIAKYFCPKIFFVAKFF